MAIFQSITVRQIAEKAQVSIATVSRVLNKTGPVRESTANRIRQAMSELGMTEPSCKRSNVILASFPDLSNPFNDEIIRGITFAASRKGYHVVYYPNDGYASEDSYRFFDGIDFYCGILVVHNVPNQQIVAKLSERIPLVMCSEHIDGNVPYVAINDFQAAQSAVHYLIATGRKNIAMINSSLSNNYAVHRERGFRAALREAGLEINENWIIHVSDINFGLAHSALSDILKQEQRPDAVFCVSDVFAAATVKAAADKQISIPRDLAIIGFDDISLAVMTNPPLTTVRQPAYQMGLQSCNLLIERIEGTSNENKRIILDTDLIVRGTT